MPDAAFYQFVAEGKRPPIPSSRNPHEHCPASFRAVVEACWCQAPSDRLAAGPALAKPEDILESLQGGA